MSGDTERLTAECRAWVALLIGGRANAYLLGRYVDAHARDDRFHATDRADRLLVTVATSFPPLRRAAAAYARIFRPNGSLQRKLILTLAILESAPPTYRVLDSVPGGHAVPMTAALLLRSATWALALLMGIVILGPLVLALKGRPVA